MRPLAWLAAVWMGACLAACLAACGPQSGSAAEDGSDGPSDGPLVVAAASSLTDVMENLSGLYAARAGSAPQLRMGATPELVRHIENGAEVDVFISADREWMDYAEDAGLIAPGHTHILAGNGLVLVAPAARPFTIALAPGMNLAAELEGGRLAIANPDAAPAGRYAREALTRLGAWEGLKGSLARAQSVRDALRLVASGAAAAGVVYETDALAAGGDVVVIGRFGEDLHTPIVYPAAAVAGGREAEAARFIDFLTSPEARAVFGRYGFTAPAASDAPHEGLPPM